MNNTSEMVDVMSHLNNPEVYRSDLTVDWLYSAAKFVAIASLELRRRTLLVE